MDEDAFLRLAGSVDVEFSRGLDEIAETGKAVVSGIEFRRLLCDMRADRTEIDPAVFVSGRDNGLAQHSDQGFIDFALLGYGRLDGCCPCGKSRNFLRGGFLDRRSCRRWFGGCGFFDRRIEDVEIDELVAGSDERARGLSFSKTVDCDALFADAGRQSREVAVAGNDAKSGEAPGVKQVHGVDDHRAVRGILTGCICELLDRLDGVFEQAFFPAIQIGFGPVAVDAFDAGNAVVSNLGKQTRDDLGRDIVPVDQQCQRSGRLIGHAFLFSARVRLHTKQT